MLALKTVAQLALLILNFFQESVSCPAIQTSSGTKTVLAMTAQQTVGLVILLNV